MTEDTRRAVADVVRAHEGRDRDGRHVIELTVRTPWLGLSVIGTPKPAPFGRAGEIFAREFLRVLGARRVDELVGFPITVLMGSRPDGRTGVVGVAGVGGMFRFDEAIPRR